MPESPPPPSDGTTLVPDDDRTDSNDDGILGIDDHDPDATERTPLIDRLHSGAHEVPPTIPKEEEEHNSGNNDNDRPASSVPSSSLDSNGGDDAGHATPLPWGQLLCLAVIALAEQTALNSISPYLPAMVSSFPEVSESQVGLYVGLVASVFAAAQFATNYLWGWLSDRIGRKPVVMLGTLLTGICFIFFGFSQTLVQAIVVQALMGLFNGNQGVISTCLGEITDRSNQSRAFTWLPVIYGLGGITGPLLGGLTVSTNPRSTTPYAYPNVIAAGVLVVDLIITAIFLKESLESAQDMPPLGRRIGSLFARLWQFTHSHRPTYVRARTGSYRSVAGSSNANAQGQGSADDEEDFSWRQVLNKDTILLFITYFFFQLGNIAYNSIYPIFAEAKPPTGRSLSPSTIGSTLAFSGVITILFQAVIFGYLRDRMGNRITYRVSLVLFVVAFFAMPWVGYTDGHDGSGDPTEEGRIFVLAELAVILVFKTVAGVGGLTCALLLITNSAPSHQSLGRLNGAMTTLSAFGRAVGPLLSGFLFTKSTHLPKGEHMVFGVFGGITFLGFLLSFGIRDPKLEANGELESDEEEAGDDHSVQGAQAERA